MQLCFWNLHQFMFLNIFYSSRKKSLRFRQFCWKISKTYSEFQIPSDWIELHPLIFLQVVSAPSSGSKNPTFYMIFYMKVGRSSFLRGASQKASIAHLCTPAATCPPTHLLPPPPTMSAFASRMVPGKPSPPRQVCIVTVSSSHCVFCKKNHWF
jgi:hypothetical protein